MLGILYALMERDLKRFLAYSRIENIGMILTALGGAMIFAAYGQRASAAFLLLAGLYHVVNHGATRRCSSSRRAWWSTPPEPGTWTASAA